MGFEIIDGYAGKAHITQEQVGDCNIGTYGPENYVLPTGRKLAYEIITNNKIRVYDGAFLIQGRRCHLQANTYVDFVVENGSQGEKRYDILAAKYVKDSVTKVENIECVTYKGTPSSGTPDDPVVDTGDIRAGESPIAFPLYRVTIDGINVTSVVPLFETLWRSSDIKGFLNAYDEIMACTKDGFVPTALGVKEGFEQLNTNIDTLSSISTHSVSSIHPWILNTYVNRCYKYGKSFTINFMFLNGDTVLSADTTIGKIPYTLPTEQKVILYNKNGGWASAKVDTNGNIILADAVPAKTTCNLESTVYVNV